MTKEDRQRCVREAVQTNPQKYAGKKLIQIVRELDPDLVSDVFVGGAYGCPLAIFRMENRCPHGSSITSVTTDNCGNCWRRVYPGREVNK